MSFYVDYKYNLFLYQTLFKFNLKSYIEPEQPETKRHISTSVLIPKISDKELRELKEIKNIDTEQNKMLETGINTDRNNDKFYSDKKLGNILKRVDEESDVNGNDIDFGTGDRSRSGIKKTFNHLGIGIPIKEVNNNNINSDDKIKNKEIKSAIKTRKGHFPVIINAWTKLGRIICRCCYKKMSKEYINQKLCEGLIENADKEIAKKFEVTEVFKALNELRLIKELVLDENDCYLLENTEKQTITNQVIEQEKQDKINKENEKENFKNLLQYLKSKEKDYQISKFKFHLLRNLKQELKDEIKHHFDDFKKKVVKD